MVTKRTKKERLSRRFSKLIKSIGLLSEKGFNNYPIGSGSTVWLSEKNLYRDFTGDKQGVKPLAS
jgi:hypothetical protein